MARFRNQVNKGIEDRPETNDQKPETRNQILENGNQKPKTRNQKIEEKPETRNQILENGNQKPETRKSAAVTSILYSESDMEPVNVAGFKVPYVVREHWKKGCREKRVKLSPLLKKVLVDEFGLPPGLTLEDL